MDAAAFEQVYESFRDFHAYFAPLFGRRETREHSGHYLQALLVQSGERRNAENLSETVPGSARGMQRFLTDSPWDDEVIIGRLQEYLGTRLEQPEGVWVLDGSDFPKQGRKSVGVARQYCGRLGKVANCQAGMFLAYVSPLGRALVDKGLYLPESWTSDKDRCEAAGVPEDRQGYRSKTELALEMVGRAQERGHLKAGWVAADDAFGMSPSFREGLAALGMWYVLDVPSGFTVWPPEPAWTSAEYQGFGRPRKPRLRDGQRRTMEQRSDELPEEAWREITVAEGSQGPRSYLFSAQRVRPTSRRKPGEIHWAVYRRHRDELRARSDLETLIDTSPVGVVVFALSTGTPVSFNREALRILEVLRTPGHPVEQLLEVLTIRRADGSEFSLEEFPLARMLATSETVRAEEIVMTAPDGRRITVLINATSIRSERGEVESVIVTLQDMTPLEELERLRAEFLGMVSHELRTPLASIKQISADSYGPSVG